MPLPVLDYLTDATTAFHTWDELVMHCRKGYIPTLRLRWSAQRKLALALNRAGLRYFSG